MKANELMIGDWVLHPVSDMPHKVVSLTSDIEFNDGCFYRDADPIPLTAEILEKNGFYHEDNVGYVMEVCENEIICDLWYHKLRILKNREQILNLEYFDEMCVHELQQALRLCGINREIKL